MIDEARKVAQRLRNNGSGIAAQTIDALCAEVNEQARLNGMGAEREAKLLSDLTRLKDTVAILLKAKGRYHTEQAYNKLAETYAALKGNDEHTRTKAPG